ncbi:Tubulin-tyrosine ligase family protein [Histomonas meleagridis]|uniref:Tubulin-tyrosine ligase family protein n=1 Tax=Histomonas meleagridis TaxID=135588 RepID=UPI00355A4CC0|nr:Tubulin-tyrosine ligase family protein [Histomonas meleagridis]KAH0801073.1 Tubulin-tyrosine ligase family protein [Histomonas meleagridis]
MTEYKKCQCWQKINHFAGAFLMGRKDNLNMRMSELRERVGDFASFYPESYLLPGDQEQLNKVWESHALWIVKPSASSRGKGIHLLTNHDTIPTSPGVVQYYIRNPLLVAKRKFDIRLYILVTSIEPLRIYMHSAGMARFATHEYKPDSSPDDQHMHLTNFSLNKDDKEFIRSDGVHESIENSKWSIGFFMQYCRSQGIDPTRLMKEFERISIATIIAGMCEIKLKHKQVIPHHHTSYEMYGIDIMLDSDLNAHLIEINISPSLSGMDSKLDQEMKYPLNLDLLRMARIIDCDPRESHPCIEIELIEKEFYRSVTESRVKDVTEFGVDPWIQPVFADFVIIRDFIEEMGIPSGFRFIYPVKETMQTYFPCFDRMDYYDTVFTKWMQLGDQEKFDVINNHINEYIEKMREIREMANKNFQN